MMNNIPFKVVIPVRYASTRLPGKPLLDIAGKPMVVHVAERAATSGAQTVVIATDDERIAQAAKNHGYQAIMTQATHASGTDRIAEVSEKLGFADEDIIVNVQGDEPLIEPDLIQLVVKNLAEHSQAAIATACCKITCYEDAFNPNIVKVVLDQKGLALYFSRAPIPFARDAFSQCLSPPGGQIMNPSPSGRGVGVRVDLPNNLPLHRHIGIYAYRASFLKIYKTLSSPAIEQFEALEQLRALWHGYKISVAITDHIPVPGIDTAEDLERVRNLFSA